jgi:hypothetical protein
LNKNVSKNENDIAAAIVKHRKYSLGAHAVIVEKDADNFKLLWNEQNAAADLNSSFSSACAKYGCELIVVGQESAEIAFYRIVMPPVNESQIAGMVEIQAESILPLPIEQMQMGFNCGEIDGDVRNVTIAAARTSSFEKTVADAKELKASTVLLNCQGIAKAWKTLFTNTSRSAVIVNVMSDYTQVIDIRDGRVTQSSTVDGLGQGSLSRLYIQDLSNAVEMVAADEKASNVFVLSPKPDHHCEIVNALSDAGFSAKESVVDLSAISSDQQLIPGQICDSLEAIGLAMLAIEPQGTEFDICKKIYQPASNIDAGYWTKVTVATVLLIIMLFACLIVTQKNNKSALALLQNPDIDIIASRQEYRQAVAAQRWDVLGLFATLTENTPKGMMLDSFSFKRNQPVTIAAKAKNIDEMYAFEKKLNANSEISDAQITSHTVDEKTKKASFKMTFNYGNVTRKSRKR